MAGTGKSTIAQTIASIYSGKGRLAASFFFSRGIEDVNTADKFVTTVASQMSKSIPALKTRIRDVISKIGDLASMSIDDQWDELVHGPLSDLEHQDGRSNYLLVVDALDECDSRHDVQLLLQRFAEAHTSRGARLRVLLTSRPEVPIQHGFAGVDARQHQDFVLHAIESTIVERDILLFLKDQFRSIGQRFGLKTGWPGTKALKCLMKNSSKLFIWAATACRYVGEDNRLAQARLTSLLDQDDNDVRPIERKLDEIYTTILANLTRDDHTAEEKQMLQAEFCQVVGSLVTLQDSLSMTSTAALFGKDVETLRRTLGHLSSVLDIPKSGTMPIQLHHPSFRDFLLDQSRCSDDQYRVDVSLVHQYLYEQCLCVMTKHLREDICDLQDYTVRSAEISRERVNECITPHVQYACRFWVYHLIRCHPHQSDWSKIKSFVEVHFLHWLEALALIHRVSTAVDIIHDLDAALSVSKETLVN